MVKEATEKVASGERQGKQKQAEQLTATGQAKWNAKEKHKDRERREQINARAKCALEEGWPLLADVNGWC